jgi:diacylglycerol kinase family enzyme
MSHCPAFIINSQSGHASEAAGARIAEILRSRGIEARISVARSGAEVTELARAALLENSATVVAGGGDGTLNTVASLLIGTQSSLGILPLGTFNHFAKDLHVPLDLSSAVDNIIRGHTVNVDVGEVNGRIFLNNSSLGLYPRVVGYREKQQKRLGLGKLPAFVWGALAVLRRYPFLDARVRVDDQELRLRAPFIFVGNNLYEMKRLRFGSRERLDAGQLSLFVANRAGRLRLATFALRALVGRLREERDFKSLCTREIWIDSRRRQIRVARDGEVSRMQMPLHYRVRPGSLRVIVPKPAG